MGRQKWIALDFSDDIMTSILPKFHVKSLGMCMTVSKGWRKLICSQHFFDLQLSWSKKVPNYIVYAYGHEILILYMTNAEGEIFEEIAFPGLENVSFPRVICSHNSLICCINYASLDECDAHIHICSPATRDVFSLPKGSPSKEVLCIGVDFGHGFHEYKVFRFFKSGYESESEGHYECETYSSRTQVWRGMGNINVYLMGFNYRCSMGFNHVFVNGKVYWFISSDSEDESNVPGMDESFQRISLPDGVTLIHHSYLVETEGFLLLVAIDKEFDMHTSIWILQDTDWSTWVTEWNTVFCKFDYECIISVAARANEIFISTMDYETWTKVWLPALDGDFPIAFTYAESLLPRNEVL